MDIAELKVLKIAELTKVASDLKVTGATGLKKQELIFRILAEQTKQEGLIFADGVLDFSARPIIIICLDLMIFMYHHLKSNGLA